MNEIERYLVEEIAVDHADGILARREALRRLALFGLTAATASTLLAACSKETPSTTAASSSPAAPVSAGSSAPAASATPSAAAPATAPPVLPPSLPTEAITFAGPEGRKLMGAFASALPRKGAVLVIHENKGLTDHIRHVAGRFAAVGYSALALDLLSEEGGTASLGEPASATAALGKVAPERFVADMRAGLDELAKRAPKVKLGAVGFCFGGGMMWRLVASKDPRLAAAVPFYGPLPEGADFTGSKAAVLGVFAEKDARVNAGRDPAKAALEKAGLKHEIITYPGVDHAFFNDTGPRYDAKAASEAWSKVIEHFSRHLG